MSRRDLLSRVTAPDHPSPEKPRASGAITARIGLAILVLGIVGMMSDSVLAAPAAWYYWRSKIDGARVCAQTSPGPGWERDSPAYEGPGCQPRRRVLIVPMR